MLVKKPSSNCRSILLAQSGIYAVSIRALRLSIISQYEGVHWWTCTPGQKRVRCTLGLQDGFRATAQMTCQAPLLPGIDLILLQTTVAFMMRVSTTDNAIAPAATSTLKRMSDHMAPAVVKTCRQRLMSTRVQHRQRTRHIKCKGLLSVPVRSAIFTPSELRVLPHR